MKLNLELELLRQIMHDFHTVTGVRSSVYDGDHNKVMAYPEKHCDLCRLMHENPLTNGHCIESNLTAFKRCKKLEDIVIYTCHAGLTEVVAPLKDNNVIIGYIVFGQLTTVENRQELIGTVQNIFEKYSLANYDYEQLIKNVNYKSHEEIRSTAKLLEACTYYIMYNEIIRLNRNGFLIKLDEYIEHHIRDKISIQNLCSEFNMSRTKLYDVINGSLNTSIGKYITEKRIKLAKRMLCDTDKTITEIAEQTGFTEYNYFCSVFKKEVGITANQFRYDNISHSISTENPLPHELKKEQP